MGIHYIAVQITPSDLGKIPNAFNPSYKRMTTCAYVSHLLITQRWAAAGCQEGLSPSHHCQASPRSCNQSKATDRKLSLGSPVLQSPSLSKLFIGSKFNCPSTCTQPVHSGEGKTLSRLHWNIPDYWRTQSPAEQPLPPTGQAHIPQLFRRYPRTPPTQTPSSLP